MHLDSKSIDITNASLEMLYKDFSEALPRAPISSRTWSTGDKPIQSVFEADGEYIRGTQGAKPSKSIAVVGAGSAGLSAIKTFFDVAESVQQSWRIVIFEQRRDVGGVWLPDPQEPNPPDLPETPLYPMLRTNTPHPSMTYPGFPFPPMTNLYPQHEALWQYHSDFASHFNLTSHIRINHTVSASSWIGNSTDGFWNVTYTDSLDQIQYEYFDHLVVASGHNHYPRIPTWAGQDIWLANTRPGSPKREILHSIFWRGSEGYENKTVLVVGTGASGRDAIRHTASVAKKMYLSMRDDIDDPSGLPPHEVRTPVSHFTADRIYFEDGSYCADVDALILGTGYEMRVPFLAEGSTLHTIPSAHSNATYSLGLVTNLRYIFPLYEHILSLAPQYPPTALIFIGLPSAIANFPSDKVQCLFAAHAIAEPSLLPSRESMLRELNEREERFRLAGLDPYYVGHRLINDSVTSRGSYGLDYQDNLFRFLKERGAVPKDSGNYVEGWRRRLSNYSERLWDNWMRIEQAGEEKIKEWLEGVETEEEWSELLDRLGRWKGDE